MKKLMFAAAAVTAGFAMAATTGDAIVSANIVGYAHNAVNDGFTVVTPQFQNIGDDNFSLLNFNPGEDMYDNIALNQIDEFGTAIHTYTWTTSADDGSGEAWNLTGWADDDWILVSDPSAVAFIPGESVIASASAGATMASGQVRKEDATIQLRNGFTLTGNPYPTVVHVADILPSCPSGTIEDTYDQMAINLIDDFGTAIHTYTWTSSADDGSGEAYNLTGWADDDWVLIDLDANDKTLAPGEGSQVSGSSDLHYLTFPAPEL